MTSPSQIMQGCVQRHREQDEGDGEDDVDYTRDDGVDGGAKEGFQNLVRRNGRVTLCVDFSRSWLADAAERGTSSWLVVIQFALGGSVELPSRSRRGFPRLTPRERNHQGKNNVLLFPAPAPLEPGRPGIHCQKRLGGLLRYYSRCMNILTKRGRFP